MRWCVRMYIICRWATWGEQRLLFETSLPQEPPLRAGTILTVVYGKVAVCGDDGMVAAVYYRLMVGTMEGLGQGLCKR